MERRVLGERGMCIVTGSLEKLPREADVMQERWDEGAYAVRDGGGGGRGVRGGRWRVGGCEGGSL